MADATHEVNLTVNGVPRSARVPARRLLADFLRHDLGQTGTHLGCEHGVCGACTVLLGWRAGTVCLLFAVSVDGQQVTTMEEMPRPRRWTGPGAAGLRGVSWTAVRLLHPGICHHGDGLPAERIRTPPRRRRGEAIGNNLCRCTGYQNIVASVLPGRGILRSKISSPKARSSKSRSATGSGGVA